MSGLIRTLFGSPTAEYQAEQSEASQDQETNADADGESEGNTEISPSDDDGPISPIGSPPAATGGTDRSQRVLNRVRSLPRLRITTAPEPSSPDPANMTPMFLGVIMPNPATTEIVLRATSPDPPSHSYGRTLNDRLAVVPDVPDGSVSRARSSPS